MKKEVRQLVKRFTRLGWTQEYTGKGHVKLTHPCGRFVVISLTPSDHFWLKNAMGDIRRLLAETGDGIAFGTEAPRPQKPEIIASPVEVIQAISIKPLIYRPFY